MPDNQNRINEISRIFRLLGLDSMSERERMLSTLKSSEQKDETEYQIITTGDTKLLREEEDAKLESNPQ